MDPEIVGGTYSECEDSNYGGYCVGHCVVYSGGEVFNCGGHCVVYSDMGVWRVFRARRELSHLTAEGADVASSQLETAPNLESIILYFPGNICTFLFSHGKNNPFFRNWPPSTRRAIVTAVMRGASVII